MLKNESGVSEIIGALMILLIMVIFIGSLQVYEVPKWNKALEEQQFEKVYSDFVELRSDLEDVSIKDVPRTSNIDMGIRYPERFILRNPGPGAYGTLTTYPLPINVSLIDSVTGNPIHYLVNSTGIEYKMSGLSDLPALVYEHGMIIKNFGTANISVDDNQSLLTADGIFIPVIVKNPDTKTSLETESFNFDPVPSQYHSSKRFLLANVTLETRYPDIWKNWFTVGINQTECPEIDTDYGCIKLTNVPGYDILRLGLIKTDQMPTDKSYSGTISIDTTDNSKSGNCKDGQDMWMKNQICTDLPTSQNVSKFLISDIATVRAESSGHYHDGCGHNHEMHDDDNVELVFSVKDNGGDLWTTEIKFKSSSSNLSVDHIFQISPSSPVCVYSSYDDQNLSNGGIINLTSCYRKANISTPNVLIIDKMENIIYANFLIN